MTKPQNEPTTSAPSDEQSVATIESLDPYLRNYAELLRLSAETLAAHGLRDLVRSIAETATAERALQ